MARKMSPLGERLNKAYLSLKVDQSQFAEMIGISRQYANAILNDKKGVGEPVLKALATKGVNVNWLLTGDGPMLVGEAGRSGLDLITNESRAPIELLGMGFALIPLYSARAGAGEEKVALSEEPVNLLAFREEWIRGELRRSPGDLFLMSVEGDSMVPTLVPGEVVLVDKTAVRVLADAIYLVRYYDGVLVKRAAWQPEGLQLLSDNPSYPPRMIKRDELENGVRILGRVIWGGRRY